MSPTAPDLATRPSQTPPGQTPPSHIQPDQPRPNRNEPNLLLELAAALLVPAGAVGFIRVFDDVSSVVPVVGASLLSTGLALVLRRLRVSLVLSALVSLASLTLLFVSRYAPGTARLGIIPTGESLTQIDLLFQDGLDQFQALRAPVPDLPPFIAATMIAAWVMAFLTDWGAQRLRLAFEPVLPASLLFIFSAVLGGGGRRGAATVIFALAVIFWAVAHRATNLQVHAIWLSADRRRGPAGIARNAVLISLVALVIGMFVGPRLPGADEEELFYWRSRSDPSRTVLSPFVEIGDRLVEQQEIDLFRVTADRPSYWRMAGLDTYDGEKANWTTQLQFTSAGGELPGLAERAGTTVSIIQQIEVQNLAGIWLPAAYAPTEVVESAESTIWNLETASLALSEADGNAPNLYEGMTYTLESVLPLYTAEELNAASDFVPQDIRDRFLPLPDSLTPRIRREALEITAGATTRYEQALALQNHFRSFDYSLSLSRRVGDPVEQFLDERVGFCQQFSGTFALMARSLGLPTRVAVGFTWGDPVPNEPNVYQVTGRQTHAWPEVWFDGLGWVAFEPTPGRGAPDAAYTGVSERQDSLVQETLDDPTTPTTVPLGSPTTTPRIFEEFDPQAGLTGGSGETTPTGGRGYGPTWLWYSIAAAGLYAVAMPVLFRIRRANRHRSARSAAGKVEAIWADVADDLERNFELRRGPSETRAEFAERISHDRRVPDDAIISLANAVTIARFGGDESAAGVVDKAEEDGATIRELIHKRTTVWERWRTLSHPRHLLRSTARLLQP